MGQLKYKAISTSQEWLAENSFFYSKAFSDPDDLVFIHRFPVYKWGLVATLVAEMRLHINNGLITIDVYDVAGLTRGYYAPFYHAADNIHKDFIEEIIDNIKKECERLKLEEWDGD